MIYFCVLVISISLLGGLIRCRAFEPVDVFLFVSRSGQTRGREVWWVRRCVEVSSGVQWCAVVCSGVQRCAEVYAGGAHGGREEVSSDWDLFWGVLKLDRWNGFGCLKRGTF